jgi:phosphoribosylformylglycinamidine synthase
VVVSAHDCADGGLAVAIAECAVGDRNALRGCRVVLNAWAALPERALLYGEAQGRAVLTTRDPAALLAVAERHGVPARVIGQVGRENSDVTLELANRTIRVVADSLANAYHDAIPALMSQAAAAVDVTDTLIEH